MIATSNIGLTARIERQLRRERDRGLDTCVECRTRIGHTDDYALTSNGFMHAICAERSDREDRFHR